MSLRRIPFHVALFAIFPILALMSANILEIQPQVAIRPLVISLISSLVLLGLLRLITGNWLRAGFLTSFIVLLFFSYGHIYEWLQAYPLGGISLGRHRFLAPVFAGLAGLGIWLLWKVRDRQPLTGVLNLVSLALLIFPTWQLISHAGTAGIQNQTPIELASIKPLQPPAGEALPDVYYIVLDTYTRSDALKADLDYDNQPFVDELRGMGFYVADCARSNYNYTLGSMTATLNLNYITPLKDELKEVGYEASSIWVLLKQSGVRHSLQKLGYETVAFKTTYAWSELTDADVYLGPGLQPAFVQTLTPFEMLLLRTSAASIISDSLTIQQSAQYDLTKSPFAGHIQTMQYMLNELPAVSKLPGHKFVFVHVLIPHIPYVFKADGSLQTDTGYFSGEQAQPINEDYLRDGYTAEVAFINSQMVAITREILANSTTPPIIVIHGDHGLRDDNRLKIFEAVYLPGGEDFLYPNITPVNLFRVIFNARFGTDYDLLPDASYSVQGSLSEEVAEDAPACLP